ncbi:ketoacyl-ACP synthase III [Saprospiraceae bacterium]|nr:ketoacyl-ACP synthase III [Saprospiraceae bacterium]
MKVYIKSIASYIPENKLTNEEVTKRVNDYGFPLQAGLIEALIGPCERRYAATDEQTSDLAVAAAKKILKGNDPNEIDLLIFASACADLIEPATSNIVQHKLGLRCSTFDIKNTCNSVANAIDVGCAMIRAGLHKRVLIASGEKPSDSIKFEGLTKENIIRHLAPFSFGDAGVALILEADETGKKGFFFQKNISYGEYWNLCQVPGGGSMHPNDGSKLFFEGDTSKLKEMMETVGPPFIHKCMEDAGLTFDDIDFICSHQVSKHTARVVNKTIPIGLDKIMVTFPRFGNTASTSMPIAYEHAIREGKIKSGDTVLLLGLAAGLNISVQIMTF